MIRRLASVREAGRVWIAAGILFLFASAIWIPALDTPFWGDDYLFVSTAHAASVARDPWWAAFWPQHPSQFWRPLAQESFWRLVDVLTGDDPRAAHVINLGLFVLAGIGVGALGLVLARSCEWPNPLGTGALGGLLYLTLALNILPVHWVSAANSSILVIFTTICLALWMVAARVDSAFRFLLLGLIPILLTAALLSKESAALTPILMLTISFFVGANARPRGAEMVIWLVSCAIVAVWLVLRAKATSSAAPQYDLILGTNLIRNLASLGAWLLNIPREALRMLVTGPVTPALLWITAVAVPMLAVWSLAGNTLVQVIGRRQLVAAGAFVLFAYAPYLPLALNSYAYYAAIAAILPTLILARGLVTSRFVVLAVILVGISSAISVQGTRMLDHPGLIGRARWAERALSKLEDEQISRPLLVHPADELRFYAIGAAGLAWRLGLDQQDVRVVDRCPDEVGNCLELDATGEWSWKAGRSRYSRDAGR
jgi:hypothetical protein